MPIVRGKIFIKEDPGAKFDGVLYVRILDTSRADASSEKVNEMIFPKINLQDLFLKGKQFKLQLDEIDNSKRYEVSVLLDFDGDGKRGKGDYITKKAYPVLTRGYPDYVEVEISII